MLQVKATRILRRGDLVNRDHGKVETFSETELVSVPAGLEGPSIPEPVVHPLPAAAFSTNPIATSFERGERERWRLLRIGRLLISFESDSGLLIDSLSLPFEARGKWKGLEGSVRLRGKLEKGEEEDMIVAEEELITVSMGIDSVQQREDKLSESA